MYELLTSLSQNFWSSL